MRQAASVLIFLSLYLLIAPKRAYAYLDPGSGSFIFQLALGALLGISVAIKIYWKKVKAFFVNLLAKKQKNEQKNNH